MYVKNWFVSNSEAKNKQVSQLYYMIFVIRTFGNLQIYLVWGMLQLQGLVSEVLSGSQYLHFLQHCKLDTIIFMYILKSFHIKGH